MSAVESVTEEQTPDTGEDYDHIAWDVSDELAMCGHRFRERPGKTGRHSEWNPDDPWAMCPCGSQVCPECIDLCLVFEQLEEIA